MCLHGEGIGEALQVSWFLRCRSSSSQKFESFRLQTLRVSRLIALYDQGRKHTKEAGNSEATDSQLPGFSACHLGTAELTIPDALG